MPRVRLAKVSLKIRPVPSSWLTNEWWESRIHIHPTSSKHPTGFTIDARLKYIDIWWSSTSTPYHIELARADTPSKCLEWLRHMGEKEWPGMTSWRVTQFIEVVTALQGFKDDGLVSANSELIRALSKQAVELDK